MRKVAALLFLCLAACGAPPAVFGQQRETVEVTTPGGGKFVFSELRFDATTGEVSGVITNRTGERWRTADFVIDAEANCDGRRGALSLRISGSMGVDPTTFSERPRWDPPWSVRCAAKYFTVQLASGKSIEQTDRDAVLQKSEEIAKEAKRTADREAVQEQAERFRSEEEKRIAAKKVSDAKEAIEEYLRNKAEADHQAKLKATCVVIRKATIDRKVSDLTVRETQQVKACQALGIY